MNRRSWLISTLSAIGLGRLARTGANSGDRGGQVFANQQGICTCKADPEIDNAIQMARFNGNGDGDGDPDLRRRLYFATLQRRGRIIITPLEAPASVRPG